MQQRQRGYYTGNKYNLLWATHRYNTIVQAPQGTGVETTTQKIVLLTTNMQGQHQANIGIEPTTGASLEYKHLIKVLTKDIW